MRKTEMAHVKMRKILVKDMNDVLVCTLCGGYLIDATTLTECHHVFCRGCILRYFENCKTACPSCNLVYKKKNQVFFKADPQIQSIVYKVVPGLYSKEMQRREDFYRSTGVRASSSCSDDSVLERERDLINDEDSLVSSNVGDKSQFFGPEDSISLSLEYYQIRLDKTGNKPTRSEISDSATDKSVGVLNNNNGDSVSEKHKLKPMTGDEKDVKETPEPELKSDQRFLQCPAAVSMRHLQKFVRMKFALTQHHKVDIIYEGEVLPQHFSLMDVAYTFKWNRTKSLRFFYRIFTPLKIQPIKIVTTLSTTGKQMQVVSSSKSNDVSPSLPPPPLTSPKVKSPINEESGEEEEKREEKERLLAHLQLQSRTKVQSQRGGVPDKETSQAVVQDCVFHYEEQDKEEIKRFAEKRDREWALQKKMDESREKERDEHHHFSKKRKKSKHSKSDFVYKKRKLHAEITNKEEELKLKVKLTQPNGHKHKHHKSSSQNQLEMSSKEKLLQMRQIRHKHVTSEDKSVQIVSSESVSNEANTEGVKDEKTQNEKEMLNKETLTSQEKPANGTKCEELNRPVNETNLKPTKNELVSKSTNKEWGNKVATVQLERNEQTEQQAKKSFQNFAEKYQKFIEKTQQQNNNKIEITKNNQTNQKSTVLLNRSSTLERKIANLQQRCTIEPKKPPSNAENKPLEKKPVVVPDKSKLVNSSPQYPPGFTVSKIDGTKRKSENEDRQEKRPSLEITLINPPSTEPKVSSSTFTKPAPSVVKRPPPATIPLDRIKKSFNFKSGISIIPKAPEKCDNIGALDLSAKQPSAKEETAPSTSKSANGLPPPSKTVNISNLQMLSKVAAEHPPINKTAKPRPQVPNLQTLRVPSPHQRIPPNLKMIDKSQFRMMSPQIRNLRPNQNQSIRNIPNPSLLVRQQQNRLNSMNPPVRENNNEKKEASPEVSKVAEAKTGEGKEVTV